MKQKLARLACLVLALFSAIRLVPPISVAVSWLGHQYRMATDPALMGGGFELLQVGGGPPLWVWTIIYALLLAAGITGVILLRPHKKEKNHEV